MGTITIAQTTGFPNAFSVSADQQVYFSQGNLQYQASTNTWQFATNQYDYIGSDNANISQTYSGWIDLFGWGTSGYNHGANCYQPWSTSQTNGDYYAYGSHTCNLCDQTGQADWGYNVISNGGNQVNSGWRTLTKDEWAYLFNTRATSSGIRYAKATVNDVNGVILLPDDWNAYYYTLSNTNTSGAGFSSNVITATQWVTLEQHGAVFLPAAGYRSGTSVSGIGSDGCYWSASYYGTNYACYVGFDSSFLIPGFNYYRYGGLSVRLVRSSQNCSINATPSPAEGGAVSGAGAYMAGAGCTLTATASAGYHFVNWTENGTEVSTSATYTFTVTGNRNLVANFANEVSNVIDFESGSIPADWNNSGSSYPWIIWNSNAHGGTYCMASSNYHVSSSESYIEATVEFTENGSISFYSRVSSESSSYDYGRFYIDGTQKLSEGGSTNTWTARQYDVSAGTHTFRWYYRKDSSVDTGEDRYYIDDITFSGVGGTTSQEGALNGLFSVSASQQVYFSQGNLQYKASTNTWQFAANQYDYIGSNNSNISQTYSGWIDLFGWGTSGYNHGAVCYQPWSTSETYSDYYAYGQYTYNLYGQTGQADWGYNAISNGGNQTNQWRTLTEQEWYYVFDIRATTSGIRYAKAKVNNVNGVILLPDDWQASYYTLNSTNTSYNASFSTNVVTASQWAVLEQHGAVFLPAAGFRLGTSVYNVGGDGNYCSASYRSSNAAFDVYFNDGTLLTDNDGNRGYGRSVRLVRSVENYSIQATPSPAEGGAVSGAGAYMAGAVCTLTATPSAGYTFSNWTENGSVISTQAAYSFRVTGDRTLVANFTPNTYTVTLNTNGGTINSGNVTSYTYGVGATLPTDVTRTGYTFGGWYANSGLTGSAVTSISTTATGNKTYWAKWTANTYTVTLNTNNGTINSGNVTSYTYGVGATLPTDVTRTGYTFGGWYDNSGLTGSAVTSISTTATGNKTFWAKWTINSYSINASANPTAGGTVSGAGTYNHGSSCTLTATPATGYNFTKWTKNGSQVSTSATYTFTVSGTGSYVAQFTKKTYAITATSNPTAGGSITGAGTYEHGSNVTLTATAATGYTFVKWTKNGTQVSTNASYSFTATAAGEYVAHFSLNSYAITASSNPAAGGTVTGAGTYDHFATCTLTATAATGYSFVNWTESGTQVSTNASYQFTVSGTRTLVANFSPNTYSLTLNTNGGTINSGNVTSYTYGVGATLPTNVTRTGYTFGGWYDNSGLTGSAVTTISTTATGNKTYWAKWTANTYTVTLNTNGGTINSGNVTSYTYGVGATLPTNVTCTGYSFGGWYDNSNLTGTAVTTISTTATGDKAFWAKWTINSYAITATANPTAGGTITGAGTYNHGTSVTLTATAATGYTFVKWTKNGTQVSTNASYSFTATSAGEYVAHFSLNSYAITASANPTAGGTITGAGTYDHFATCTLSATAATGYSFVNWTENNTAVSTSASYQFTVTGARTLVANFSPNTYTVTLNTNGGTINSGNVTSYTYGVGATLPTDVTRTGYTFGGWFANSGLTGSAVTTISTTATGNKTYYAKWTANTYTVTLNTNGGTINSGNVTSYTYGVGATLPTDVTRTGYTFDGWYDNSGLTGSTVTSISNTATGDKAFWAKWTINSYAITVSANPSSGGTVSGAGTYNHGTSVTLTATAATGYHFVNWTKNGTQVSTDASYSFTATEAGEYVAHFSLNSYEISANANPSGGGTFTGTGTYDHGSTCTLTAIPNEGYYFMYWKHGNTMVSTNPSFSFVVTGDDTYTAYFDIFSYNVDAYADPEEYGSVTGADDYLHGSICTLTATANEGYHFVNWTEDDEVVSTDAVYSFTVTDNRELVAHFSINSYEITANANPAGGGTFTGTGSYDHGSTCTLTAIPNEGYYFLYWKHGNTMVSTNASVSFVVTGDDTYTAYFDIYSYYVDAYADPDDYGTVTGADEYLHGSTCTLTATANEGYHFVNWTEDDVVLSTDVVYSFTVTDNRELIAHFSINSYEITATSNPSAGGILTGAGTYNHGANVTLTATANEGYTFVNWTENGNEVATSASFSFTATEARSLTANFSINSYAITVTANPTEGGSVTGAGTYNHGTTVTLVAIAVEGYTFENWTKDDEVVSTETTYSFTATAAGDYVAHFSLNSYEIIASANYPGSCTITGAGTYDHGAMVTLTAVANTGYNFLNWTKDGVEVSTTLSFSFTATESGTYVANFLPKNYTITVKANPTAGGTVSGGGPHSHGSTCTLTATPNEGYYFLYWKKSGNIVSYSPIYSFEVTGGGIYTAYFSNVYTQEVSLTPGWNWWAPTVQCTLAELETALGTNGLTIKSKDASATYSNGQWSGTLTELTLGQMYRIETSNTCEFTLNGTRPASVTLTLSQGQTWFGCTGSESLTIANAFANFTPTSGDKIISQDEGFAIFNGTTWEGTLDTLQPGHGYVYVSQGGNTQTAIFGTPSK